MLQTSLSKVIPLDQVGTEPVGGKAAQLAQLVRLGLRVPEKSHQFPLSLGDSVAI